MAAKEMFEELNYNKINCIDNNDFIAYESIDRKAEIIFDIKKRTFKKQYLNSAVVKAITLDELKAINKQVEELGWN